MQTIVLNFLNIIKLDFISKLENKVLVLNEEIVKTYEDLEDSTKQSGKIVYLGKVNNNTLNYQRKFRLRMWMSDNVTIEDDIFGKSFSVRVNVLGIQ